MAADVHDNTVAHHLTGYAGAAGTGDEVGVEAACFMDELYDFRFVFWKSHGFGHFAIGGGIGGIGDAVQRVGVDGHGWTAMG